MGVFSASGIERAIECPASAALPQVLDTNEDAERGTAIHEYCKRHLQGWSPADALALVPRQWRGTCAAIDFKRLFGGMRDVRAEVAYAINVEEDTAEEIGVDINRNYPPAPPHIVHGTIDVEGTYAIDGVPSVDDWKSGHKPVAPCRENWQMRFAARAKQLTTGSDVVRARILYIRESGSVDIDSATFTRFDLDCFVDHVREAVALVQKARALVADGLRPTVNAGEWCGYCAAMPACPAYTALARTMLPELEAIDAQISAMTPAQGGSAWVKAKTIKRLVERVEEGLKALADRHPLPTRPGKEVRPIGIVKNRFKKDRAIDLLIALGATPAQLESLHEEAIEVQYREVNSR